MIKYILLYKTQDRWDGGYYDETESFDSKEDLLEWLFDACKKDWYISNRLIEVTGEIVFGLNAKEKRLLELVKFKPRTKEELQELLHTHPQHTNFALKHLLEWGIVKSENGMIVCGEQRK